MVPQAPEAPSCPPGPDAPEAVCGVGPPGGAAVVPEGQGRGGYLSSSVGTVKARPARARAERSKNRGSEAADKLCAELVQSKGASHITMQDFFALQCGMQQQGRHEVAHQPQPSRLAADSPPATTAVLRHRRPRGSPIYIDTTACRYNVVRFAAAKLGWMESSASTPPNVTWIDTSVSEHRLARLTSGVHINHFPGMLLLCRKVDSARLLAKMQRQHPDAYSFVPATYTDYDDFTRRHGRPSADTWFISKPDSGCMGKGIRLTNAPKPEMFENAVVQSYVADPLLIDNCKWDMRVYVLVLSVDPLKVYVYREGLVRLCTEQYHTPTAANAQNSLIHLTNYAIHKKTKKASRPAAEDADPEQTGCKRTFSFLFDHLRKIGRDPDAFWGRVEDLVVKSVLAVKEHLKYAYKASFPDPYNRGSSCFEILGFDVLADANLQPWLLEVNHAPSFTCDSQLDFTIKAGVIEEAMLLLGVDVEVADRTKHFNPRLTAGQSPGWQPTVAELRRNAIAAFHKKKAAHEAAVARNYHRVFPSEDIAKQAGYTRLVESLEERLPPPQAYLVSSPPPVLRSSGTAASRSPNGPKSPQRLGGSQSHAGAHANHARNRTHTHHTHTHTARTPTHASRSGASHEVHPVSSAVRSATASSPATLRPQALQRRVSGLASRAEPVPLPLRTAHRRF